MILAEQAAAGVPFAALFRAATGRSLLAQAAAVIVCGLAALLAGFRPAGRRLAVLGAAAAAALFTHAQAGHAETPSAVRLLNVADLWAHMLAAAVWAGGLVWLLLGLRYLDGRARVTAVGRFSQLAFASVAILAVTGVLRAVPEVGSLGALVSTSFGVVLLIKTGLFAVLTGLAWRNRYRLVPRVTGPAVAAPGERPAVMGVTPGRPQAAGGAPEDPPPGNAGAGGRPGRAGPPPGSGGLRAIGSLRRSVRCEVTLAGLVLVAAAVLSGRPPASFVQAVGRQAGRQAAAKPITVSGSDFGTTVRVRLMVSPGTAGPNQRIAVSRAAGQPTLYTVKLADGYSMQGYLDPVQLGAGVVHFTFFAPSGSEAPVTAARGEAITPAGAVQPLKLIRFDSKGHFGANLHLTPGRWTFRIDATRPGGQSLSAYCSQAIGR